MLKKKARKPKKKPEFLPFSCEISEEKVQLMLPLLTISEGNCFEPWRKKHARHKKQHEMIAKSMLTCQGRIKLPCTVTLIRYGSRLLDSHDNLPISQKYVVDKIAEVLTGKKNGKGDSDIRLSWKYSQEKSVKRGLKIIFDF